MITVDLLGPPRVALNGRPFEVDTRKAIALLAYLVVERSATRDTLAALFWGESPQPRARATLRRTLSALRGATGAAMIEADRNLVTLVGEVTSDVDLLAAELTATTEHGHDRHDVCTRCIPHLEAATDLYRGDFLEGFSVQASPEFDDWVRGVAISTRIRIGDSFNRLGHALAANGEYQAAIDAVGRWIDLDPLHEPAHRFLMLLHAWGGDRPGAVEAYRRCVAILDQELGVPPLEETTELYEAILDEDLPPAPGMRRRIKAQAGSERAVPGDLIDRLDESGELDVALERTRTRGEVVALSGQAWMGKSRLLEDLAAKVTKAGIPMLLGRAYRMEQGLPFGVAAQLLRSAEKLIEADRDALPGWALTEMARLVPEIDRGPSTQELTDPFGELRLFDGVFAVLQALSENRPIIVAVDDAQWLDPASAALVSFMARRVEQTHLLLIVSVRSGEPVSDVTAELVAEAGTRLELQPLTVEQLKTIAGSRSAAESLRVRTAGIPLLVNEELSRGESPRNEPTEMVRYMEARLRDVSDLARQVVTAAAVLGGACDAGLLRETSGRTEEEVVEAVEELVAGGLLREEPDGDSLRFPLDALERLAYESTSLIRRRLLHRRAAAALTAQPASETDPRLTSAIAAQHEGAGSMNAAPWYQRAGDLSRQVYANASARDMYRKALGTGHPDPASIHLALGEVAMVLADYEGAMAELNTSAALAQEATLGRAEHRLGEVQRLIGKFELAEEHFSRSENVQPTYELYADWALLRHRLGDVKGAARLSSMAMELAGDEAGPSQLSRVHNIIGVVSVDPEVAAQHLDRALDLAGDDDLLRLAGLNNRAHLFAETGDLEAAVTMVTEAVGIAERTGNRHREAALHDHLADLHHRAGREEEAQRELTIAVTLFSGIGSGDWLPEVWLLSRW